jgi:peptidoglycan/LPS O-acetylase OafA/YrhL
MVEHLWALSVVGKIYILAPCVLAIVEALRRWWRLSARRTYPALLAALTLASFVYALVAINRNADVAYYELPARVWQFSMGGLIAALRLPEREAQRSLAVTASWLGVFAALSTGASVGASGAFPGAAALWPVCAAALVLVFARSSDWLNAGSILGMNLLRRLGRDSYGLYMWHWPLAVLALNATGWASLSWGAGAALIAASWALAVAGRKCGEVLLRLLAAGASELRDFVSAAWRVSASSSIGWPAVKVAEVEAGRVDPWTSMVGED